MASITDQIVSLATSLGATASGSYTIASAIDLLADTLAGSDQEQRATIAGALGELSGKISKVPSGTISITENGEGIDVSAYATADVSVSGGASVGGLVKLYETGSTPEVGASIYPAYDISTLYLGELPLATAGSDSAYMSVVCAAEGVKCATFWVRAFDSDADNPEAYLITVDTSLGYDTIATMEPWDGVALETMTDVNNEVDKRYVFTVPEVQSGVAILYRYQFPD